VTKLIYPPSPVGVFGDQARLFEQSQMARHGRTTDGQGLREFAHGMVALAEQTQDGAPVWIPQRVEGIPTR
jgi:hypothetical protein